VRIFSLPSPSSLKVPNDDGQNSQTWSLYHLVM
jgi:hypothetical protein